MKEVKLLTLVLAGLALFFLLAMTSAPHIVYLPFTATAPTPTCTATLTTSPTPTPTTTPRPAPLHIPNAGDLYQLWGYDDNMTYQVWINNIECECRQWICGDDENGYDDHVQRYDPSWTYVGEATGTHTFMFPFSATDIVVTWGDRTAYAFDSLIAIMGDRRAGYAYTVDGEFSAPWMDSGGILIDTQVQHDLPNPPLPTPCGIAGPVSDNSYSLTLCRGGIIFRFVSVPYSQLIGYWPHIFPGERPYSIDGIHIEAKYQSEITSTDAICP